MTGDGAVRLVGLGARVHLFVRPEAREALAALFRDVLGCEIIERDFGLPYPIALVRFPDGSAFSVETSELAPPDDATVDADDQRAFRGPWLEFRTPDAAAAEAALRHAGVREFHHPGSRHSYFIAPGGQVFRVLDVGYAGP